MGLMNIGDFCGFHNGGYEDVCLLECDVVWLVDKCRCFGETCCLRNNFTSAKKQVPPKCRYMSTRLLGVTSRGQ
jgi:hypothetical protein